MSSADRRAAVLGQPVGHSLSPVLHNAGYAAAGLTRWRYTAVECARGQLKAFVDRLDPAEGWAGLSVTMPLKEEALHVADTVDPVAAALGAANTLVPRAGGWYASNTDAPGMVDALRAAGVTRAPRVAVLGAGGTARAALHAAAALHADEVRLYARRPDAVVDLRAVARYLHLELSYVDFAEVAGCVEADVVISTVPRGVVDDLVPRWRPATVLFDAVYDPWPTPLAAGAAAAGCPIVSGLDLLLAQAVHQFTMFTGVPAPVAAMRSALRAAAAAR